MAKSPAEALKDSVVKESITAVLKPAGFRKSSSWFHRRHGATTKIGLFSRLEYLVPDTPKHWVLTTPTSRRISLNVGGRTMCRPTRLAECFAR